MKSVWSFLARAFRRAAIYCATRAIGKCDCAACRFVVAMQARGDELQIEVVTVNETQRTKGIN